MLDNRLVVFRSFGRVLPLVSETRRKAIEGALKTLNFNDRRTVDAAYRALTQTGYLDQLCDFFFAGRNKAKSLQALAALVLYQLAEDPKHNPHAVNPEPLLRNRQDACRTLAGGLTASAKTMLLELERNDIHTVANAITDFLSEADWRCLAAEMHLNDGKEAPCRASSEKAALAFTACAVAHANRQRWAQEAAMRQAAAAAFTAAYTAARQAGAAFVGDLLAKAADAQWLAVGACEKTRPSGWSRPDRELREICDDAARAARQAGEAALRDEDRDKYFGLAVHAYTLVGQYTDVAKIHRQRANEHLSQFRFSKAAEAFQAAAMAELEGKRPSQAALVQAAIDLRAGAGALLKISKPPKRFSDAARLYEAAARAYRDAKQYREAASAALDAAAAYERDHKPFSRAQALELAARALAQVPDPLGAAALWMQVADIHPYIGLGRYRRALALTAAGSEFKKGGKLDLAEAAHLQAETLYMATGEVERAQAARAAADACRPKKLNMAAFEKMAPANDQVIVEINALIDAHQVALQSVDGLQLADGRRLYFEELCCYIEQVKFVPGTRVEFVLLFCQHVGNFVIMPAAQQLVSMGRHHIERRELQIGDVFRGEALLALLSQVN
ncbi:hypothetical protein [Pandoraea oxalativorans]|uniref:Uncharacterized protein n=1 Tax=Pandoraea oxalativorans TaxID=573737 RepID=A0A0G3IBS5_9BURK|nr:hypothetical protein [Pandoraea oxalativorans]AKK24649.1 hypothetical protein MB84_27820 [Pandoraea oxalativorans]